MSIQPGDDDDDIEKKMEELIESIGELTDFLRFAMAPPEEVEGPEEGEPGPQDLWDEGTTKAVDSLGEFRDWRTKAARSEDVSSPFFRPHVFDSSEARVDDEVDMFISGYRNLNELYTRLSEEEFEMFLAEYLKEVTRPVEGGEPAVASELLDIYSPGMQFYGVVEIEGELTVQVNFTPFDFISAYDAFWHYEADVSNVLGLSPDPQAELVLGEKSIEAVNKDLARAIHTTRGMELPGKFANLLPAGMRENMG